MPTAHIAAFDLADRDDDVRVVIVTGAGRGFCAGSNPPGDASTFDFDTRPDKAALGSPKRPDGSIDYGQPAVRDDGGLIRPRAFASLKLAIAAIDGLAVGIGLTMTLPMDVRPSSTAAWFGLPFTRRGIVPEAASSWFLPRPVGICQGRSGDAKEGVAAFVAKRPADIPYRVSSRNARLPPLVARPALAVQAPSIPRPATREGGSIPVR